MHTIAIRLKIPDNTAYSALTALRRLGVNVASVERSDIWQFEDDASADEIAARVRRNESLFNPNKHELEVLSFDKPRAGEIWIEELAPPSKMAGRKHYVGWRLGAAEDVPADAATLREASEKLLCNPAIERAIT